MIKTVLIDDERLARVELRRLLDAHSDVTILAEASQIDEALATVAKHRPDLVFLDIQMPGATGFDVLEKLEPPLPEIVFVTAYDEHALRAFEYNALDYLLKPVDPERLAETLLRARARLGAHAESQPAPEAPEAVPTHKLGENDRVFLREGEHCWLLPVGDIEMIEAEGNYSIVHFGKHAPMLSRSLSSLEERLDPSLFFRANRSQIINLRHVKDVDVWFSGSLKAKMAGGYSVELSRRQASAFRERLSL